MVRNLCKHSSGVMLIAGTIGVLTGVEQLMSHHSRKPSRRVSNPIPKPQATPRRVRDHYFSIRRTKSELGYIYWVLQGFGRYQGFTLFDTWQEAMDEAVRRSRTTDEQLITA